MRLTYLFLGCVMATGLVLAGCGDQAPFTPEENAAIKADVENTLSTQSLSDYDYVAHLYPYLRTPYGKGNGTVHFQVYPEHIKYHIKVHDLACGAVNAKLEVYPAGKLGWADVIKVLWGYYTRYYGPNVSYNRTWFEKYGYITKYDVQRYGYYTLEDLLRAFNQGRASVKVYTACVKTVPINSNNQHDVPELVGIVTPRH